MTYSNCLIHVTTAVPIRTVHLEFRKAHFTTSNLKRKVDGIQLKVGKWKGFTKFNSISTNMEIPNASLGLPWDFAIFIEVNFIRFVSFPPKLVLC